MKKLTVLCAVLLSAEPALAAEALLPVSVRLIQCGPTVEQACREDSRCCALLDSFELAQVENSNIPSSTPKPQELYPGSDSYYFDLQSNTNTELLQ